jgi:hypothetical protein
LMDDSALNITQVRYVGCGLAARYIMPKHREHHSLAPAGEKLCDGGRL